MQRQRHNAGGGGKALRHYLLTVFAFALLSGVVPSLSWAEVGRHPLPDARSYEQVSPVDKNESDVLATAPVAALDGNGLVFASQGSFAGQPTALLSGTHYLVRRNLNGWETDGIGMPNGRLYVQNGYQAFSPDLSKGVLRWIEDTPSGTYDSSAVPGLNLYVSDDETRTFQLLNGTRDQAGGAVRFGWATPEFGQVIFQSDQKLTAEAPCNALSCPYEVYEWAHGVLRLASILPDGTPTFGVAGAGTDQGNIDNAISDDGSRVFFTTPDPFKGEAQIYVRENASQSMLITESERTLPGGAASGSAYFQGAEAAHGNRVIFTTKKSLVDADVNETNDLYMYDFTKPVGQRLSLLSKDTNPEAPEGASVGPNSVSTSSFNLGGVLARDHSLNRIWFVTENQIVAGSPTAPGPKLYIWSDLDGSPEASYIATLSPEDGQDWIGPSVRETEPSRSSRISDNGRFVVFESHAALTPSDQDGEVDIYRYDADTGSLVCVSCASGASPAHGELSFETYSNKVQHILNHQPRNVSDSGQVFFETTRGLDRSDSNGLTDVYEYENDQLYLISGGSGLYGSDFLDASASGNDVFFRTLDHLVGWDQDSHYDAYDARVNGGLPEPPPSPPPCEGDACQPAPLVPEDPTPASATFVGSGNVAAARPCGRGKVRRHGRCVRRHRDHKNHRRNVKPGAHRD